ncbi:unnamed protein product, partial [Phaeothamnion confervicola]
CADRVLYDELEVETHATVREIKRAYYRLSLEFHPDKTQGGDSERFKRLSEAYQVLQDETTRGRYHCGGLAAVYDEENQE